MLSENNIFNYKVSFYQARTLSVLLKYSFVTVSFIHNVYWA